MDLATRLKQASEIFGNAEKVIKSSYRDDARPVPDWTLLQMPTLGIAVATVEYFTPEQIRAMATLDIAHRSTIEGGSLFIARTVYDSYLKRKNEAVGRQLGYCRNHNYILDGLSCDNLEQLRRVCTTAGKILEHEFF